jgi:hypothetical protein
MYVAGAFSYMGDVPAYSIARWDGIDWSPLGQGLTFSGTRDMAAFAATGGAPRLYVVANAVGLTSGISKWDGTQWMEAASNSLIYISPGGTNKRPHRLFAMDRDGSGPEGMTLFAAQLETRSVSQTGVDTGALWRLEGQTWVEADGSPPQGIGLVDDMKVFDPDGTGPATAAPYVITYRYWYDLNPIPTTSGSEATISRLDGDTLTPVFTTNAGWFVSLEVFDLDGAGPQEPSLMVSGNFPIPGVGLHVHLARLQGTVLTEVVQDNGSVAPRLQVLDLDEAGPRRPALLVTGNFSTIGGVSANSIAQYDGTAWSGLGPGIAAPSPVYPPVSGLCVFDDDGTGPRPPALYAGGGFVTAGYAPARSIARWDGVFWMPPGQLLNNRVHTLLAQDLGSGPSLYIGGAFSSADGLPAVGIARWDGQQFSALSSGMNNHVDALAAYNGQLVAGGKFTTAGGIAAGHVARWSGSAWLPLGGGVNGNVAALAADGAGGLVAAGTFMNASGAPALRVARWNGAQWSAMGAGLDGEVRALALHGGSVYAGGAFTASGATMVNHVARWNGSAWVAVGSGIPGIVSHLVSHQGRLFAGSTCDTSVCIRAWDGATWSAIPSLTNGSGQATLTALGSVDENGGEPGAPYLYASGEFTAAGSVAAQRLARWDGMLWRAGAVDGVSPGAPARAFAGFGAPPVVYVGGDFQGVVNAADQQTWFLAGYDDCPAPCYANCDGSTSTPVLNINDFVCFQQRFAAADTYANCDQSTLAPTLNVADFICFMNRYAAGCP